MRNLSGTLLKGTMSVGETKSSICNDTEYHPIRPVAEYCRVHYKFKKKKRLEMQNVYEDGMLKILMLISLIGVQSLVIAMFQSNMILTCNPNTLC